MHRNSKLQIVVVFFLPIFFGCGDSRFYRIPVNTPWPDEWAAGPRIPAEAELALANKTIRWHLRIEPERLTRAVDDMLDPMPAVRHFTRLDFARSRKNRNRRLIPVVEVKIDAVLLPASSSSAPVSIEWTDEPFGERLAELAKRFGREVVISDEFSEAVPATVSATFGTVDPRLAFARLLLEQDLFFEPVVWAPRQIRSYEYVSRADFLAAVRKAAGEVQALVPTDVPLRIIPFDLWLANNPEPPRVIWQIDDSQERDAPRRVSIGLSQDPVLAKRQLLRTLQDRIKTFVASGSALKGAAQKGSVQRKSAQKKSVQKVSAQGRASTGKESSSPEDRPMVGSGSAPEALAVEFGSEPSNGP